MYYSLFVFFKKKIHSKALSPFFNFLFCLFEIKEISMFRLNDYFVVFMFQEREKYPPLPLCNTARLFSTLQHNCFLETNVILQIRSTVILYMHRDFLSFVLFFKKNICYILFIYVGKNVISGSFSERPRTENLLIFTELSE